MGKYKYNVNKNCIEKNGKFVAYLNVVDTKRIIDLLNEQEEELQKMRFAFKQKYDYDIEDVVDEVYNMEWGYEINYKEYEVDEPEYYIKYGFSPVKAMEQGLVSHEEYIGFLKGNVIKYVVRAGHKDNAVKDINKAIDYLNYLKEEMNEE